MIKLSVVLATRNEEANLMRCLESAKRIADEIIVVDEYSSDRTREIAKKYGAKVYLEPHHEIFHITKQKALEKASGKWTLQLDADEVVTSELASQLKKVINDQTVKITDKTKLKLFHRHQQLLERRDGQIGKRTGEVVAYFLPRRNIFLGQPLIHAGVYPDGVIRLVKNCKAHFPQKSVHEQIEIDGEVAWLSGDLLHYDSPTLKRYFNRLNRYTDLEAVELNSQKIKLNLAGFLWYSLFKPLLVFSNLFFYHKGFLDGSRGFLWCFFSACHYPIAFLKYLTNNRIKDDLKK